MEYGANCVETALGVDRHSLRADAYRLQLFEYTGWNTFPIPKLTEKNKEDLSRSAEDILIAREQHFPATIAELYKPNAMPANLRAAHQHNDGLIEQIYIGRRFKNDSERLEKLFSMYTKMTTTVPPS